MSFVMSLEALNLTAFTPQIQQQYYRSIAASAPGILLVFSQRPLTLILLQAFCLYVMHDIPVLSALLIIATLLSHTTAHCIRDVNRLDVVLPE